MKSNAILTNNISRKMKRINGVDTIRGLSIWFMIYGHLILFWLRPEDQWLKDWLYAFLQPIGATGFLFISGVSALLAFKKNLFTKKVPVTIMRKIYLLRATFILIIGLIFNLFNAFIFEDGNLTHIWSWNALQTIAISLMLLWPLLRTSKTFRLLIAITVIITNQILLVILTPYNGQYSLLGVTYHLFFNPSDQYVILIYFGILVVGSVIGDIVFDVSNMENNQKRDLFHLNKGILYAFFTGIFVLIFGITFQFPSLLTFNSISSVLYSIGIIIITLVILILIEIFEHFKTKKSYRYLYFYSYYSFTIFLGHNLLLILFYQQLNAYFTIWIAIVVGNVALGLLFRAMYKKMGPKLSLKAIISSVSFEIVTRYNKKLLKEVV
jgi:uncharacterized membrane protein